MKKVVVLFLSLLIMMGICSYHISAAELNDNEKYILKTLADDEFPYEIEQQYINQLKNYFYGDTVSISRNTADRFISYLKFAIQAKGSNADNIKTQYFYITRLQRAMNEISLYVEYDSEVNDFYAVNERGNITIDFQPIIKKTDEAENIPQEDNPEDVLKTNVAKSKNLEKVEKEKELIIIICIFTVPLIIFLMFMQNQKIKRKVEKKMNVTKPQEPDLQKQMIVRETMKYIWVPFVFTVIFTAMFSLTINMLDIKERINENLTNGCYINKNYSDQKIKLTKPDSVQKKEIAISKVTWPQYGAIYGRLYSEDLRIDTPVFWGDRGSILEKGAGNYCGSTIPGTGGCALIGAHDTTYFEGLKDVKKGEIFTFDAAYGSYKYKVSKIKIYDSDSYDKGYNLNSDKDQMVLYTCYPFGTLEESKTKRMFVTMDKISGPDIKEREQ